MTTLLDELDELVEEEGKIYRKTGGSGSLIKLLVLDRVRKLVNDKLNQEAR